MIGIQFLDSVSITLIILAEDRGLPGNHFSDHTDPGWGKFFSDE
jgi:hypothetical protein